MILIFIKINVIIFSPSQFPGLRPLLICEFLPGPPFVCMSFGGCGLSFYYEHKFSIVIVLLFIMEIKYASYGSKDKWTHLDTGVKFLRGLVLPAKNRLHNRIKM